MMGPGQDSRNSRLFGFSYKEDDLDQVAKLSPVPPNADDGVTVAAGGLQGFGVQMDPGGAKDAELIRKYRCMALHPEVDGAIEDIVNEAIVSDTNDSPLQLIYPILISLRESKQSLEKSCLHPVSSGL